MWLSPFLGRCGHRSQAKENGRLTYARALFFTSLSLVILCVAGCSTSASQVAGTWSGPMMIDGGQGDPKFVNVAVTFTQNGDRIEGHWRTLDAINETSGDVSGTVATRDDGRQAMNVRFTFAGRHPVESIASLNCVGAARSEGQVTYNTTIDTTGQPAHERPGWAIRLKAFEGITFDSCPAIRYATWTLTRQSTSR